MKYRDPERPSLGGRPSWLAAPLLALPDLVLEVSENPQRFNIRVLLANSPSSGHWVECQDLGLQDVARLMVDWHDDPEEAIGQWFHAEVPEASKWAEGRGRMRRAEVVLVMGGDVDPKEMGL